MKAAQKSTSPADKKRINRKCEELVLTAETLKKSTASVVDTASHIETKLKLPRQARQIPTVEKNILYRNSRLHGNTFPPWESDPDPTYFHGDLYR